MSSPLPIYRDYGREFNSRHPRNIWAGTQRNRVGKDWVPACAGMTSPCHPGSRLAGKISVVRNRD